MEASYPSAIKNFTTKADGVDLIKADDINAPQAEITAIETTLGTNPQGASATVAARLETLLEKTSQAADSAKLGGQLPSAYLGATAQAADSAKLGGQLPSAFLGATAQAADSAKLGGQLPSAYLGATAQAADSAKLGGVAAATFTQMLSLTGYTPTWSAAGSSPSLGDGTLIGRYCKIGSLVYVLIHLYFGPTTTAGSGNWAFSLPFQAAANGIPSLGLCHIRDGGVANYERFAQTTSESLQLGTFTDVTAATNNNFISQGNPFTFGAGDSISITLLYESA